MKYKSEILYKRRVVFEKFFNNKTHPNQVVVATLKSMPVLPDNFIIYVLNENGEYWRYAVTLQKNGKYFSRRMEKTNEMLGRNEIDMVFSGNKNIVG